jgi:phosphate transport system protein
MGKVLERELSRLQDRLLHMGSLTEQAIGKAIRSLTSKDAALAEEVIEEDKTIDVLEIEIDEHCVRLLALHKPEAVDLRFVTMAFKINNDLERMGDLAVNIAERTRSLLKAPMLKPLIDVPRMAELTRGMVTDSLDSFVRRDAELARNVCRRDDEVDNLNDQLFRELLTYMMQDPKFISRAIDLILIGRHLERIADLATNVAEDVYYLVRGETIKHGVAGD